MNVLLYQVYKWTFLNCQVRCSSCVRGKYWISVLSSANTVRIVHGGWGKWIQHSLLFRQSSWEVSKCNLGAGSVEFVSVEARGFRFCESQVSLLRVETSKPHNTWISILVSSLCSGRTMFEESHGHSGDIEVRRRIQITDSAMRVLGTREQRHTG